MGVASTYHVTRETAIKSIKKRIKHLSDEQLGDVLDNVINNRFYNFVVLPEELIEVEKKNKYFCTVIDSFEFMPEPN